MDVSVTDEDRQVNVCVCSLCKHVHVPVQLNMYADICKCRSMHTFAPFLNAMRTAGGKGKENSYFWTVLCLHALERRGLLRGACRR